MVAQCAQQLVRILAQSEGAPCNIDRLLLAESMDVIGELCSCLLLRGLDPVCSASLLCLLQCLQQGMRLTLRALLLSCSLTVLQGMPPRKLACCLVCRQGELQP